LLCHYWFILHCAKNALEECLAAFSENVL